MPDGVGLRNFAFTSFVEIGEQMGWEVVFWNQTPFDLNKLGFGEIKSKGKPKAITDLLKRTKISAELDFFEQKYNDKVYQTYKFPSSSKNIKDKIKNAIVNLLIEIYKGEKGLSKLRANLKASERGSLFYKDCKAELEMEKPDFVFCTNQRPVNAIAPLTAAQDLGIPTATFIFSWDNLPKATMIVEPDFYFVWSNYMKQELSGYYPNINPNNIFVTGSPQFEPHFNINLRKSRQEFFAENNLDIEREYICFSGDDKTTSPYDAQYLQDVAEAVEMLNKDLGTQFSIIFRRCPVDFSDRYDKVLKKYKNIIVCLAPKWQLIGGDWNSALPTQEDLQLQVNTILHTKAVVNLGSSMVFDFALFDKPCFFINYNVEDKTDERWSIEKIYNYVHFKSMPTGSEVIWLNSKKEIENKLKFILNEEGNLLVANNAMKWFKKINEYPPQKSSIRIWNAIQKKVYLNPLLF